MYPYTSNVFSSSTTVNESELATFPHDQPFLIHSRPFLNDITTDPNSNFTSVASSSNQEQDLLENSPHHLHPPLSSLYFPSFLEDDDVLLQQQQQVEQQKQQQQQQQQQQQEQQLKRIPTMRRSSSSKKDRHSKIRTARGLRDRRMRLSLEVALKFFGLQDMLGFDKASKTVEWLLNQAAAAIRKLKEDINGSNENQSSISECEVVSCTDEAATDDVSVVDNKSRKPCSSSCPKKRSVRKPRTSALFNPLVKASRVQARAKARQRTEEKMKRSQQPKPFDVDQEEMMKLDLSRLSSWSSSFETGEGSGGGNQSHSNWMNSHCSSMEVLAEVEAPISSFQAAGTTLGVHQDLIEIDGCDAAANLVAMGKWSPYSNFSSLQTTSASVTQEQQQFADSQFYGKPWEVVYNSSSIYNGF